jgi:hypothetical protein
MEDTLSYYNFANGWTSRWSYVPEWMIHMNSNFYTFKNGNLYLHNLNNTRNNFYGQQEVSTLSTIFNIEPTTIKKFKNIWLDSNHTWEATMHTNLDEGFVDYGWYDKKEGRWYASIRRPQGDNNPQLLSTQGIGNALNYVGSTISFSSNIPISLTAVNTPVSFNGDKVYKIIFPTPGAPGVLVELGNVLSFTSNSITLTNILNTPAPGDPIVIDKNAVAESFGPRGYYLQVDFENDKSYEVTMFAVGASVFKSFP